MSVMRGEAKMVIAAPIERVYDTLIDYDAIPNWQSAVESTRVIEHDPDGRGLVVEFRVDIKVKKLRYVNRYTYEASTRIGASRRLCTDPPRQP